MQTEFVKSVSCGAHCTAAIAEPRDNDGTISTRRLWVWGQNQVIHVIILLHDDSSWFLAHPFCCLHCHFPSLQGSNYPRIYWGAFTPDTVLSILQLTVFLEYFLPSNCETLLDIWTSNGNQFNNKQQLLLNFTHCKWNLIDIWFLWLWFVLQLRNTKYLL